MTAGIYLDLFSISTHISQFLQSPLLNYLNAFNMINNLSREIKSGRLDAGNSFTNLYSKVQFFIKEIKKK